MHTCLVLVTHNRLDYTRKCLSRLLSDEESDFELWIWDNGSRDGTRAYLESLSDRRICGVEFCPENRGQTAAMNWGWRSTRAEFVAKVDNDCLMRPGWMRVLGKAHSDILELGAVACWHYRLEDFNERASTFKIQRFGSHRLFRHPWVCGSGFVLKRATYLKMGPWPEGSPDIGTTEYFLRMSAAGYVNGWYYPFILQEHMDDPFSPHCLFSDDAGIQAFRNISYTLRVNDINSYGERLRRRRRVLRTLRYGPCSAAAYQGIAGKVRRILPAIDLAVAAFRNTVRRGAC